MLKDQAILVSLTVTKPQVTQKDKQTSREVAVDKNASAAAVSVVKRLYPKHLLAPIQEVESSARRYVESVTQPWARGLALLPTMLFMSFQESMGVFEVQFNQAVTVFLNNYANTLQEAQREQGEMFNDSVYPDVSELKASFGFGVTYIPIADVPSLALDLEAQSLASLKQTIAKQTTQSLALGQAAIYRRLASAVERIKTQCSKEEGRIFDSLTGNLDEMLKVLPALNLSNDPHFAQLCEDARALVVSPAALRAVPALKATVADRADSLLKAMEGYL